MKLQLIAWRDHWSDDGSDWKDVADEAAKPVEPMVCHSVGWVFREDEHTVSLLANLNGAPGSADCGYHISHIVKAAIVRRTALRESPND